ncbi:carbon storage regulator CsrA [Campylobacter fetus]|uniref:Translational regulator CsrA n=1 Tax=Campylobacter fetus subsp. testudinum TaxID=1507806 RepID=A0AAX0HCQ2_CAMFE|nr:carbon storage regulator CsrA [Campylobacter fetus]AGZ81572.1 carbon storage regulator [Campylobacter fetus subsp. testudinum 03-427]AJB45313.1 carbon storage regulator [Campylobacter fetus subsp. testudinum]ALV64732.1 carbon storage regulator [Campylobacter fetus subsp. testudinum Sp3]AVK80980.1 carbon storage regulator [Campylobacter fetus subsp. testudinum]EAI4321451.1 carbon storage regulator CsrA [Campylobacter fetus]
MLILTRKDGESIKIEGNIEIKVIQTLKNGVKIGIEAPKNVMILRSELMNEIANSNLKASLANKNSLNELSKKFQK